MKFLLKFFTPVVFSVFCFTATAAEKPKDIALGAHPIEVSARMLADTHFPASDSSPRLEWVGGLDLTSGAKGFGGLSSLRLDAEGRHVTAVSDAGLWLRFELLLDGEKPVGIKNAELAPMLDPQGKSIAGLSRGDSESLALVNGDAFVGFERTDTIWRYPLGKDGLNAVATPIPVPAEVAQLRHAHGLETLAAFPPASRHAGALLAIGEGPVRGDDNLRGWIIDGQNFRRLTVLAHDGYEASDGSFLDNGNFLLLERRFRPPFGIACRIRTINGNEISGGARLEGKIIFEADARSPVDNMEGIAVHKGADGATYVTLVSDDNFNIFQRTLLLRFKLADK
jgi:hypothetical protein